MALKAIAPNPPLFVIAQNYAPCRIPLGKMEHLPTVHLCGNEPIAWLTDVHFFSFAWPLFDSEQPLSVGNWERRQQEAFSVASEWLKWLQQCALVCFRKTVCAVEKSRSGCSAVVLRRAEESRSAVSTDTLPSLLWLEPPLVLFRLPLAGKDAEQGECGHWPVRAQPQGPWPLLQVWSLCGHFQVI